MSHKRYAATIVILLLALAAAYIDAELAEEARIAAETDRLEMAMEVERLEARVAMLYDLARRR